MSIITIANITVMIDANTVAWYAAIVATASAFASGYSVWRDRTKIKVIATPNMRLTESMEHFSDQEDLIFIQAANVGRRPVILGIVWFKQKGTKKKAGLFVKSHWEPSDRLEEGQSATMLCKQKDIDIETLKRVVVRDATGRKWCGGIEKTTSKKHG